MSNIVELILSAKDGISKVAREASSNFTASASQMEKSAKAMDLSLDGMASSLSESLKEIPGFSTAMQIITNPAVLAGTAIVAVGTALKSCIDSATEFNSAFTPIKQLNLDKSGAEMSNYKDLIQESAFAVGGNLKDAAKAFFDIQSATGLFGGEVKAVYEPVAKFAWAVGADLSDSMNATVKAMKAFGFGVNQVDNYLIGNAKTVQVGITNYKELATVQTEYLGAAKAAGVTLDDSNKLFAAFTSIAKDTTQAANLTKTAFQGLTQQSTVEGLQKIGVNMYDANGKMRDMTTVMKEASAKFQTMTDKDFSKLIGDIGGPEGLRALMTKLKTGAEDFFSVFTAYDNTDIGISELLEQAQGDINKLSELSSNLMGNISASIGEAFLPMIITLQQGFIDLMGWVKENGDTIVNVLVGIGIAATAVGFGLTAAFIAAKISAIGFAGILPAMIGGLGTLTGVVTGFGVALNTALGPIGWVVLAITALSGIFVWCWNSVDGFKEGVLGLLDSLVEFAAFIGDGLAAAFTAAWETIKAFFANIWKGMKNFAGGIVDMFSSVGKIIKGVFTFDFSAVSEGVDSFKTAIGKTAGGLLDAIPLTNIIGNYDQYGKTAATAFNKSFNNTAEIQPGSANGLNNFMTTAAATNTGFEAALKEQKKEEKTTTTTLEDPKKEPTNHKKKPPDDKKTDLTGKLSSSSKSIIVNIAKFGEMNNVKIENKAGDLPQDIFSKFREELIKVINNASMQLS